MAEWVERRAWFKSVGNFTIKIIELKDGQFWAEIKLVRVQIWKNEKPLASVEQAKREIDKFMTKQFKEMYADMAPEVLQQALEKTG